MIRYCLAAMMALNAHPATAESGLLDPEGREITLERLWDRLAAAPTRDPEFDAEVWRDQAEDQPARPERAATSAYVSYPPSEPLTPEERGGFAASIAACFIAANEVVENNVAVTVGFRLNPQGQVVGDVVLLATNFRSEPLTLMAFQSARRAILRCQRTGFDLPAEKYERWQDVEMTFDPAQMAMR